ncbi:acyl-CoA dehydrogenase family protein [Paraburkholderia phytofirmans]|uniref:acyl-CoA dehydrogenase family protein n=1 Tax=Paraburkholderia phytofirmans TaxID=261302 RepID=UPI0038BDB42E
MLDERWSEDVEEIGTALRRLLSAECTPERVREAERTADGVDVGLTRQLQHFGLFELDGTPELFARVAYELGRCLAPVAFVETMPVLTLAGRQNVAFCPNRLAPAAARAVAVVRNGEVFLEPLEGLARKTAAGDFVVEHLDSSVSECIGGADLADRLERYAALVEAARMVGAGQALLAYGCEYVGGREQFGKPIGAYQGVAHRLARAAGELDAAELLVRKSAFSASAETGGDGAPAQTFAWMARAKSIEAARTVATNVHQVFGGNGFAMEYDVQLYSRRLRSWAQRGPKVGAQLAQLGRLVLDPARRDDLRLLWHYDTGMPLPRWARELDAPFNQTAS